MSNRREFLQMSLAASALPVLAVPGLARDRQQKLHTWGVVAEATSPLGLSFLPEATRLGLQVRTIHDDVTDLWYHELSVRWREAPAVLAGVTLSTSLFCLEMLARDYGMRVWFRASHNYLPNGQVEHMVSGPDRMIEQASAFGGDWGSGFARLAAALPVVDSGKSQKKIVEAATPQTGEPGPMVSWIIAPRFENQRVVIP